MKKITLAALATIVCGPAIAEWHNDVSEDPFDGKILISFVLDTKKNVVLFVGKKADIDMEIGIKSLPLMCGSSSGFGFDTVDIEVIIDEKRHEDHTIAVLSIDQRGILLSPPSRPGLDRSFEHKRWLRMLNSGDIMHIRISDECGRRHTYSFDISGKTQFD